MHFLKERGVSSLTMESAMPLIVPAMGDLYAVLYPLSEMLLRVVAGLALVLHGLRMTFGYFPDASFTTCNLAMLAEKSIIAAIGRGSCGPLQSPRPSSELD